MEPAATKFLNILATSLTFSTLNKNLLYCMVSILEIINSKARGNLSHDLTGYLGSIVIH